MIQALARGRVALLWSRPHLSSDTSPISTPIKQGQENIIFKKNIFRGFSEVFFWKILGYSGVFRAILEYSRITRSIPEFITDNPEFIMDKSEFITDIPEFITDILVTLC